MYRLFGMILIFDGVLALILPIDKHWAWQAGRCLRIFIGICLVAGGGVR